MEYLHGVKQLIETGRWIADRDMTWGTSGNLSVRLDERNLLITASGTRFDSLDENSFSVCGIEDLSWSGNKPSKELSFHAAIYRRVPWAEAVIHASPFYATLAASCTLKLRNDLFVENMYYLQRTATIPYAHPGSRELTDLVEKAAEEANVILMRNHGVTLYDTSLGECRAALEVAENTCRMCLEAARAGIGLTGVPEETVRDFLMNSGYKKPRPWADKA